MGALARPVALTGADQVVQASAAYFRGLTVAETGGANPVTVRVYDNASAASGTLLATVRLAAGESHTWSDPAGLWASNGVYVDVGGTGVVEGSVYIG